MKLIDTLVSQAEEIIDHSIDNIKEATSDVMSNISDKELVKKYVPFVVTNIISLSDAQDILSAIHDIINSGTVSSDEINNNMELSCEGKCEYCELSENELSDERIKRKIKELIENGVLDGINNDIPVDDEYILKVMKVPQDSDLYRELEKTLPYNTLEESPIAAYNLVKKSDITESSESVRIPLNDDTISYDDPDIDKRLMKSMADIGYFLAKVTDSYNNEGNLRITQNMMDSLNHAVEKLNRNYEAMMAEE